MYPAPIDSRYFQVIITVLSGNSFAAWLVIEPCSEKYYHQIYILRRRPICIPLHVFLQPTI